MIYAHQLLAMFRSLKRTTIIDRVASDLAALRLNVVAYGSEAASTCRTIETKETNMSKQDIINGIVADLISKGASVVVDGVLIEPNAAKLGQSADDAKVPRGPSALPGEYVFRLDAERGRSQGPDVKDLVRDGALSEYRIHGYASGGVVGQSAEPTTEQIALANEAKELQERYLRFIDKLNGKNAGAGLIQRYDSRGVATARTHIETATFWLVRAIIQPRGAPRIKIEGDA